MVEGSKQSRRLYVVIGVLAVLVAAALARPATGQEHHGPLPDPAPGILPPGDWTPEQVAFAVDLVRRTEAVMPAKFGDLAKVQALGYHNLGLTAPGGYDHWGLPLSAAGDGHVMDPELPESMVFQRFPDGRQVLVAALFVLDPGLTMADVPAEYAWLPGWHTHANPPCLDDNGVSIGLPDNGVCARGHQVLEPMLHVWLTDTPCGHRFPGIDPGGLMCGHDTPTTPGSTVVPPGSVPPASPPPPPSSGPPGAAPVTTTAPVQPVKARPTYVG